MYSTNPQELLELEESAWFQIVPWLRRFYQVGFLVSIGLCAKTHQHWTVLWFGGRSTNFQIFLSASDFVSSSQAEIQSDWYFLGIFLISWKNFDKSMVSTEYCM